MSLFPLVLWAFVEWAFVLWAFVVWAFVLWAYVRAPVYPDGVSCLERQSNAVSASYTEVVASVAKEGQGRFFTHVWLFSS